MHDFLSGFSAGWQPYPFPITDRDFLFISFVFYSYLESSEEEGVYLDEIQVLGDSRPNFTYGTPSEWAGPIVPSTVQNTHTVNTLYTNQPTYIDFAIKNVGANTTEGFWTDLYLDGAIINGIYTNSLNFNEWDSLIDAAHTVGTAGSHLLEIEIDGLGLIDEADEDDNSYFSYFTWVTPTIANLTTTIPPGWNGPIVPADTPGHHYFGDLYSNQPTYIAWAIKNTGNISSGAFSTRLKIDNVVVQTINNTILAAGATYTSPNNFSQTLTAGNHVLRLEIDYTDVVVESDPNDNIYATTFTWFPATIMATGEVSFFELSGGPVHKIWTVAQDFRVELWDDDGGGSGQVLDSDYTDNLGIFELGPVSNIEEDGGRQDIYIRAYSENYAAVVGDSFKSSPPYNVIPFYISSYPIQDALSGEYLFIPGSANPPLEADTIKSGFFYIADVIRESYDKWLTLPPSANPGQTKVLLKAGQGTYYIDAYAVLFINPATVPVGFPDTFDKDIIIHEYGHRLEHVFQFFDTSEGGSHGYTTIKSLEFAASEGFGHFWSSASRNENLQRDTYNSFRDTFWLDLENGTYGQKGSIPALTIGTANTLGKKNEVAVAGMLWDIYDNNASPEDFSDSTTWYDGSGPVDFTDTLIAYHHSDNIKDTLSLGADEILNTLFRNTSTGHRPDNINDFWEAWFLPPLQGPFGHVRAMLNIWYEHGDDSLICIGIRGDINGDGLDATVLDLNYLVNRIQRGGPPSPRPLEADVNGDGTSSNIVDLNYLINKIFRGGPPPPSCP